MEVVVFTNGCFDILHPGHIDLLRKARKLGTKLIVGINSDKSVRAIKGSPRPFVSEKDRADILLELESVDEVVIFDEPTPQRIIEQIKPNILVKGGDWAVEEIIGSDLVRQNGGQVFSIPLKDGYSTTLLAERVFKKNNKLQSNINSAGEKINLTQYIDILQQINSDFLPSIVKTGEKIKNAIVEGSYIIITSDQNSIAEGKYLLLKLMSLQSELENNKIILLNEDAVNFNNFATENNNNVYICLSSLGSSEILATNLMNARQNKFHSVVLTSNKGRKLSALSDSSVLIPTANQNNILASFTSIFNFWIEMFYHPDTNESRN